MSEQVALFPEVIDPAAPTLTAVQRGADKIARFEYRLRLMHARYGKAEGKRCGDCQLCSEHPGNTATYWKCERYGVTSGPGTDWRKKWTTCGLFQERQA